MLRTTCGFLALVALVQVTPCSAQRCTSTPSVVSGFALRRGVPLPLPSQFTGYLPHYSGRTRALSFSSLNQPTAVARHHLSQYAIDQAGPGWLFPLDFGTSHYPPQEYDPHLSLDMIGRQRLPHEFQRTQAANNTDWRSSWNVPAWLARAAEEPERKPARHSSFQTSLPKTVANSLWLSAPGSSLTSRLQRLESEYAEEVQEEGVVE